MQSRNQEDLEGISLFPDAAAGATGHAVRLAGLFVRCDPVVVCAVSLEFRNPGRRRDPLRSRSMAPRTS